jgi:predicted dehydrogenase
MRAAIIGTSSITIHHINSLRKYGVKLFSVSALRKNSKNLPHIIKNYKIKNYYYNLNNSYENIVKNLKKIDFFVISGKFSDNKKILRKILKFKKKIFIEKPVFLNSKSFKFLLEYKKYIFIGYNRTKFKNIIYLKNILKNKKKIKCLVKIPEKNKKFFFFNSCHVISVLQYLFGNFKIQYKSKDKKLINFKSKKAEINMLINFSNSDNFTIEIYSGSERYLLRPLEVLKIYKSLAKKQEGINNIYKPVINKTLKENLKSKYKPGFNKQAYDFLKFVKNNKISEENSLEFAKNIIHLSEKIFL